MKKTYKYILCNYSKVSYILNIYPGLEKNETVPIPDLAEPRIPSQNEKLEAVQFSIPSGVGTSSYRNDVVCCISYDKNELSLLGFLHKCIAISCFKKVRV